MSNLKPGKYWVSVYNHILEKDGTKEDFSFMVKNFEAFLKLGISEYCDVVYADIEENPLQLVFKAFGSGSSIPVREVIDFNKIIYTDQNPDKIPTLDYKSQIKELRKRINILEEENRNLKDNEINPEKMKNLAKVFMSVFNEFSSSGFNRSETMEILKMILK